MPARRTVPLDRVLAAVARCEDGLRAEGSSAAADEVYALGLEIGRAAGGRGRRLAPRRPRRRGPVAP